MSKSFPNLRLLTLAR